MNPTSPDTKLAILASMVKKAPGQRLGRTQVMKLLYFLQELKGVELGYDFRLFNYGPFDSEVLSDLSSACGTDTTVEKTVHYGNGFGYSITPGVKADRLEKNLETEHPGLSFKIDEVVKEFGGLSASELELRSTIFFVDREFASEKQRVTADELTKRVRSIKAHFDDSTIRSRVLEMAGNGYLQSVTS